MSCDTSEVLLSDRSTPLKDNEILSPHETEEPHSIDTKENSTTLLEKDQDVAVASSCAGELAKDTDFNKNPLAGGENNCSSAQKLNDEIEEVFAASSVKPALVQHQVSLENGSMAEEEDTTSQSSDTTTSSTTSCSTSSSSGPPFDLCQAGNDELEMVIEHAIVETHHPAEVPCNEAPPDIERCSSSSNDTINGGDQQEVMTTSAVVEEELNSNLVGERKSQPPAHARDSVNQLADFDEIIVLDIPRDFLLH